jgi:ribokinase
MGDCWVIGPIAWDTVVRVPRLPERGGFVQADQMTGRPGGTGTNVAIALASTGTTVRMAGYTGDDQPGRQLRAVLSGAGIDISEVRLTEGRTSEVLIMIEPDGERTMLGLYPDLLHTVQVPVADIQPGDLVYFAAWRDVFLHAMRQIEAKGALVVTVPDPHMPSAVPASYLVGSCAQYNGLDPARYIANPAGHLRAAVMTRAAEGAVLYEQDKARPFAARDVVVVDTTGAGDAFAAGFLYQVAVGHTPADAVAAGINWAAAAIQVQGSIPPPWRVVCDQR